MKKYFILIVTLTVAIFTGLVANLVANATDNYQAATFTKLESGYDLDENGVIDYADYYLLEDVILNRISNISEAADSTEVDELNSITLMDLVRLKKFLLNSARESEVVPEEFHWDREERKYVWNTAELPITQEGIASMSHFFIYDTPHKVSYLPDGSVELTGKELYAIKWIPIHVEESNGRPNPEMWIASQYDVSDDGKEYHAFIGEDNQYHLMITESIGLSFSVKPRDGRWTWIASELPVSEYEMNGLQRYLSNKYHHEINELPDGSYEILIDDIYRLLWDKNCVQQGFSRPYPARLFASIEYGEYIYSAYIEGGLYKLFIHHNEKSIGTACLGYRVREADDAILSKIAELFSGDYYVKEVENVTSGTAIYFVSYNGLTECMLCVEPYIVREAVVESRQIAKFYVDGMIYQLFCSTRDDGSRYIHIVTMTTNN